MCPRISWQARNIQPFTSRCIPADYSQPSLRGVTLMLRAVPGADVITAVRREISAMDSDLTCNARSMAEQIVQFMSALQAASWTYGLIGGVRFDSGWLGWPASRRIRWLSAAARSAFGWH